MKDFSTPLLVVAVAILDGAGRVLMQRRRKSAVHGGLWEFPGGKVEAGETAGDAACREIAEELGLTLDLGDLRAISFASGFTGEPEASRPLVLLLYACDRWDGAPRRRDGDAIAWHDPRAVAGLAMPPLDYPLARALERALAPARVAPI